MKNKLIISLTLLTLLITACGGQANQTPPEPAVPTQTMAQPTLVPTSALIVTGVAVPATEATALATDPAAEVPVASVSFVNDVLPVFVNSCNECHGGKQIKEGLDLRTYESVMAGSFNGTVIVAGDSAQSLLVELVTKGKMPKRGPKLTAEQIQIIRDWIDAGALNN